MKSNQKGKVITLLAAILLLTGVAGVHFSPKCRQMMTVPKKAMHRRCFIRTPAFSRAYRRLPIN